MDRSVNPFLVPNPELVTTPSTALAAAPSVALTLALPVPPPNLVQQFLRLPTERPFTSIEARERGLTYGDLRGLVGHGLLRHPIRGVYVAAELPDTLELRVATLKVVVPEDCVVTDRTAGWLWGANMILAPNDHLEPPLLSVFCPPGLRLRNGLTSSGERRLARDDVVELNGLLVTTPLRTACDLGRLLHRDQAIAALDSLAALGRFSLDELLAAVERYKGYRGVIQLRWLVLIVDPRSQSPGESILRLRWLDAGLPRPECQVEVPTPWGRPYVIDIGLPDLRFGGEYDGDEFHGPEQEEHDESRRVWLRDEGGWLIEVARKENIHGRQQDIHSKLQIGYHNAVLTAARR
jgi:hypothetical protein